MSSTSLGIFSLPNELLLLVFKNLLPSVFDCENDLFPESELRSELPWPLVASSICRVWRDLVITTPDMWTFIKVSEGHLDRLPLFLDRSSPCTYDLIIPSHMFNEPYLTHERIIKKAHDHFDRMRSLILYKINAADFALYHTTFSRVATPHLEHFCLYFKTRWSGGEMDMLEAPLFSDTTALRSLCLRAIPDPLPPMPAHLTHLEIRGFSPTRWEFQKLFSDCPSLKRLCLPTLSVAAADALETESIDASSLRSLSFSLGDDHPSARCCCTLSVLHLPNLEYLEVLGGTGLSNPLGSHFLNDSDGTTNGTSFQKVSTLHLSDLTITEMDVVFCHKLTAVTNLELHLIMDKDIRSLLRIPETATDNPPLPFAQLNSLTINAFGTDLKQLASLLNIRVPKYQSSFELSLWNVTFLDAEDSEPRPEELFHDAVKINVVHGNTIPSLEFFSDPYDSYGEDSWDNSDSEGWAEGVDEYEYDMYGDEHWFDEEEYEEEYEEYESDY
ncbi:hypothetical protein D9758_000341 [Tetrapyrgos nigripes]|uniref:F-box domain-containing protein n=1 Tax=Tetrapyrgos nigripes TaxID=182062 RepID=A0A8H5H227_9AGAR|nr:hypothetical protein D9758_000341 [Tetrapyrgos nigripes]